MHIATGYGKRERFIYNWLITGCVLIVLLIVVGGITRLTQSGLSMVKWEPIMGTLPPLSQDAWQEAFDLYKQSPEFHHYNAQFTLSEFKSIFFWEYLHRLIARILGLVFIIPFIIFWRKGYFTPRIRKHVLIIFALGICQAGLGWFMVKSGLVDKPHVSHYRLAAHLVTALSLLIYIYWVALSLKIEVGSTHVGKYKGMVKAFIALVFLQITYGAFVAGLKGGYYYTTFPKMGTEWFPKDFSRALRDKGMVSFINNPGLVQFVHRIIAYLIVIVLVVMWAKAKKVKLDRYQRKGLSILTSAIALQFILGVLTLLNAVPVSLGVLHQFGAIFVLFASFYLLFTFKTERHGHI